MVSPTTSFIEELAQLDKIQLARSTSDLQHGGGVVEEEGDKDDAFSSQCCFIRTSSFRRTMRGKKSGRCKKRERSRNLVSSLLDDILELVVEKPAVMVLLEGGNDSTRFFPQLQNLQMGSPELQLTTRLSCSTPCHVDSACGTPSSYQSFHFEPSMCQLSKEDAHNATVLYSSVSSDGGSFSGDVLRALDEKLCGESLSKSLNNCEESILRFTTGASMKPPLMPDSAVVLEKMVRSPSRRGDRIALISPAPFRASLPKEMPKAKVEIEILRRRMANSPCFPGRYSFLNFLVLSHILVYFVLQLSMYFSHSMLMSWLSSVLCLEFSTLPMDLVNNLVLTIGNTFLNLGILVPAEVKAHADSVIEVKFCHDLIFSPILRRVQGCIVGNTCRTKRTNHWRN